jgi:hypothetical protein
VTLNIYGHVMPTTQQEARRSIDDALGRGSEDQHEAS